MRTKTPQQRSRVLPNSAWVRDRTRHNYLFDEYRFRLRLDDQAAAELARQAAAVTTLWNIFVEHHRMLLRRQGDLSTYALLNVVGNQRLDVKLRIRSGTAIELANIYVETARRRQNQPRPERSPRAKGWIPFNANCLAFDGSSFQFLGQHYKATRSWKWPRQADHIGSGAFEQDAQGRWHVGFVVEFREEEVVPSSVHHARVTEKPRRSDETTKSSSVMVAGRSPPPRTP
jgi:hypothetical protein